MPKTGLARLGCRADPYGEGAQPGEAPLGGRREQVGGEGTCRGAGADLLRGDAFGDGESVVALGRLAPLVVRPGEVEEVPGLPLGDADRGRRDGRGVRDGGTSVAEGQGGADP